MNTPPCLFPAFRPLFFGVVLASVGARGKFWDTAESGCRAPPKGLRDDAVLLSETKIPLGSEVSLGYLPRTSGDLGKVGGEALNEERFSRGRMACRFLD